MINTNELNYSREEIRRQVLEILDKIFKKKNLHLDKDNSSYLIFLSNLISSLSADVLFYQNFLFGESNLITANLPSSVNNWANYIDYAPKFGIPAKTTLTFYVPIDNFFTARIIPFQNYFSFGDLKFTPNKPIDIIVNPNANIEIREITDAQNGVYRLIPHKIILTEEGKRVLTFSITAYNLFKKVYTYKLPSLRPGEFYDISITLNEGEFLVNSSVLVGNERWKRGILVLSSSNDKVYDVYLGSIPTQLVFRFGNGIYGKQPSVGDITLELYLCQGSRANIQPLVINSGDTIYTESGNVINYSVTNTVRAEGGKDAETIFDTKRNAILNLRKRYRNVSYQDYEDDLVLNYPEFYKISRVLLYRSDNFANDVYVYTTLMDGDNNIIPTSTITVNSSVLSSNVIKSFHTVIRSIATFDSHIEYYSPFTIVPDLQRGIWVAYETLDVYRALKLNKNFSKPPPYPTNFTYTFREELEYKVDFDMNRLLFRVIFSDVQVSSQEYKLKRRLIIRRKNGVIHQYSLDIANGENIFSHSFSDIRDIMDINLLEFQIYLERVNGTGEILIEAFSSKFNINKSRYTYGPLYRLNNNIYYVGIPVIEKTYYNSLTEEKKKILHDIILGSVSMYLFESDKKLFNTTPFIRFCRTVGRVYNVNLSKEDYIVKGIVYSRNEAMNFPNLNLGDMLLVSDPINPNDPWHNYAGKIALYIGNSNNERIFQFIEVPRGTTARIVGEKELYVLVDTRFIKFSDSLPLEIEVEIFVENPSIPGLEEKYKKVIEKFVNSIEPDKDFRLSELISELHKIKGTKFVRFIKPKYDLIYNYDYEVLENVDKLTYISFVPEKLNTNLRKIKVYIKSAYAQ